MKLTLMLGVLCAMTVPTLAAEAPSAAAVPVAGADAFATYRKLYDYDATVPLDVKITSRKPGLFANVEYGTLVGARGHTVPFILALPKNASPTRPAPTVMLLHGLTMTINDFEPIALYLAAQGYACIMPEIVDHGDRGDGVHKPSLRGFDVGRTHDGIIESVGDARRTLDYVVSRPEIARSRIGFVGMSLGSIMGSIITSLDDRIRTAVFLVGGADWKLIKPKDYPADPAQGALLEPVDPKHFVGKIAPRPILFINAIRDEFIGKPAAEALFAAAGDVKKQVWLDSGHVVPPLMVVPPVKQWLEKYLQPPS